MALHCFFVNHKLKEYKEAKRVALRQTEALLLLGRKSFPKTFFYR